MKLNPQQEADIMEDIEVVDSDYGSEKASRRQLFGPKSPLRATDPNAQLGTAAPTAKDPANDQAAKFRIENVNIGGLTILDHQG